MSVEVRPVDLPGGAQTMMQVWWDVYAGDPHWVPPLRFERKKFLDPKHNPYFKVADVQCFVAFRDGRPVGTISAQVDHGYQRVEDKVGFFGFFEFPDDEGVARPLLDAALAWLRGKGMTRAMGPFNFNTNHECSVLVDGYDSDPLVMMIWNRPYYPAMYEKLGLAKAKDMLAYWMRNDGPVPPRIAALADRFLERHPEVKIRPMDKGDFENEVKRVHAIYNSAWEDNWGFVKMTDEEFWFMAHGVKEMIDPRYCFVAEIAGEAAAFSITLPDYNMVVKPMNGRVLPFGWWHWLTMPKKIDQIRVFALGVHKKYQNLALGAPLYKATWDAGVANKVKGAEASWILEDNTRMRGALEKLGAKVYKTYRIYGTPL
ncbi:MAG: N-acetyltransferase [Myxococcota bacterium]